MPNEQTIWQICEVLLTMYERWGGLSNLKGLSGSEVESSSIWRRAAEYNLPVTKSAVRQRLEKR